MITENKKLHQLPEGQVWVKDNTRPTKDPWAWSKETFERYTVLAPGKYSIVAEKKLIIAKIVNLNENIDKGQPKARQKRDNSK